MGLIRFLIRLCILVAGAFIGVVLFFFAVLAFVTFLLFSVLTGKKPNLQFRVNKNPWAHRRPPSAEVGEVVDIEAREVKEAPLPLQQPERQGLPPQR